MAKKKECALECSDSTSCKTLSRAANGCWTAMLKNKLCRRRSLMNVGITSATLCGRPGLPTAVTPHTTGTGGHLTLKQPCSSENDCKVETQKLCKVRFQDFTHQAMADVFRGWAVFAKYFKARRSAKTFKTR